MIHEVARITVEFSKTLAELIVQLSCVSYLLYGALTTMYKSRIRWRELRPVGCDCRTEVDHDRVKHLIDGDH